MTCPNCGQTLVNYDSIDTEYWNDSFYETVRGECENCFKTYRWTEVYIFNNIENFEEEKENEFNIFNDQ